MFIAPYIPNILPTLNILDVEFTNIKNDQEPSDFALNCVRNLCSKKVILVPKITLKNLGLGMGVINRLFKDPILIYNPHLEADQEAFKFILKHLVHHIYKNRQVERVSTIACQLLITFATNYFIGPGTAFTVNAINTIGSYWIYPNKNECHADLLAIETSSAEEIRGGLRYLIALQTLHQLVWRAFSESRNQLHENGDMKVYDENPPLSQRIKQLHQTLLDKHESTDIDGNKLTALVKAMFKDYVADHKLTPLGYQLIEFNFILHAHTLNIRRYA